MLLSPCTTEKFEKEAAEMNKRSFKYAWVSFLHLGSCSLLMWLHVAARQPFTAAVHPVQRWPFHFTLLAIATLLGCSCSMSVNKGTA